ncbi:hypothetical protein FBY30_1101 [Arthrobacter sp. SLBN-83]|uniref:hypothetical protein n=1 Tax=Arthrobacter sp. SLBN-83 TaxID=2768449 RepID=UPI00116C736D|nr:hypothetical protein [Arthrobacter sp. SLBN-83]TQJ58865.1 hypothetical protein FBY30_1101 [Arthrobacter sp. SLBN-83]
MSNLIPSGALRRMLLPPTYGRHVTSATEFTILSVEVWASGLVVNIHLPSDDAPEPRLILQDHFGTEYTLQESATVGSRNLQVFAPSVPPGTRSLTIRSADDSDGRPVVTFAVPLMAVPEAPDGSGAAVRDDVAETGSESYQPDLRRPA